MKKVIQIYTDGACSGNPGKGGWGALLIYNQRRKEIFGGEEYTTNNRMELLATIKALQSLNINDISTYSVEIYTDSMYVKNGITKWIDNWKKSNWRTSNKKPVKNKDLWHELDILSTKYGVMWHWVKGHCSNAYNILADKLSRRYLSRE